MTTFSIIDLDTLSTITGGAAQGPQQDMGSDEGPQSRTWGQVAREYGAACVTGAGQALMFGGMPRSAREAAGTAAFGCATGVGMKAVEDLSNRIAGQ